MNYKLSLDTNAYTALGIGDASIAKLVASAPQIGLPQPVLGEIYFDMYNGTMIQKNSATLTRFLQNPRVSVLEITNDTARLFGEIATQLRSCGRQIQQNDIWIAALCKQYNYQLATNDVGFTYITSLEVVTF